MDERVARLRTPEECEQFALNVEKRLPDLARAARRRAVELRAASHNAATDAEREALEAVYAYERVETAKRGKKFRANRTWQIIERRGIIGAVEHAVNRKEETIGYAALASMEMQDFAFEAVVLRHRGLFSEQAVGRCSARMQKWRDQKEKPETEGEAQA